MFIMIFYDIKTQQKRLNENEIIEFIFIAKNLIIHKYLFKVNVSTKFVNINLIIKSFMKKCKFIQ